MSFLLRPRLLLKSGISQIPLQCQPFSSTSYACAQRNGGSADVEVDRYGQPLVSEARGSTSGTYENWVSSTGRKYMHPNPLGPKWLGRDVPFPLNPTFKPPTPLSDAVRSAVYEMYVSNPARNNTHAVSTRYGISIKRIEAIIKLKSLEAQWKKQKPLQTGFLAGMEGILGVPQGRNKLSIPDEMHLPSREDAKQADKMSEHMDGEKRKRGLSRTFFEPVDEDKEPIVPQWLQDEQKADEERKHGLRPTLDEPLHGDKEPTVPQRLQEGQQANMKATPQAKEYPSHVVQPNPSRPAFKFIDVGLRWFNPDEAQTRKKESARRKDVKSRRAKKLAAALSKVA
ncbi:eukaryotic mitochondrial regulator protein-domain-containing protein [Hysterangium stoloniferum]|nr:eukaryotic mitochondrial regulator protein-domain-containing protein [Hysterangium stoloniferum]